MQGSAVPPTPQGAACTQCSLDDDPLSKAHWPLDGEAAALLEAGGGLGEALQLVHQLVEAIIQLHKGNLGGPGGRGSGGAVRATTTPTERPWLVADSWGMGQHLLNT